jgi:hypothetical protein
MEPTFNFNVSEFASKVEATESSSAYMFLQSDTGLRITPSIDTDEIHLNHVMNINNELSTSSSDSTEHDTSSDHSPSTENNPTNSNTDYQPLIESDTRNLDTVSVLSNYHIRSQIQGWRSSFMYDYVLVKGKPNIVNYSLLIPDSYTTLVSYNMKPERDNFKKFFTIRKYNKKPVYYVYDGKTSLDEAMWWIFEYPEDMIREIKKPTCLPPDATTIFNSMRIEALKRLVY